MNPHGFSGMTSHHEEKTLWPQRATSLGSAPASGEDDMFGQLLERCASLFWLNEQGEGSGELRQLVCTWYHWEKNSRDLMKSPRLHTGANRQGGSGGAKGLLMFSSCCPWCSRAVPVPSLQTLQPRQLWARSLHLQAAAHPKQSPPNQTHHPQKHTVV